MGRGECCCCLSFLVLLVGFTTFFVGASCPRWYVAGGSVGADINKFLNSIDIDIGLYTGVFFRCVGDNLWDSDHCEWIDLTNSDSTWWKASAGLMGGAVLFGLIAIFLAMIIPVTAAMQIVSGVLGLGGSILWMIKMTDLSKDDYFNGLSDLDIDSQWGFVLAMVGCCIMLLNGILLGIFSCCCNDNRYAPICCCCPRRTASY